MWFSVACFCNVSLFFDNYILSSVKVAEWPPFWKKLPARLAILFSLYSVYLYFYFVYDVYLYLE